MSDFVWVLRHPTLPVTKTWKADGTIAAYGDSKLFIGKQAPVNSIRELSDLLIDLDDEYRCCIIRGKYKGYEHSLLAEPEETKKDRVLRRMSVHDDVEHHWMLVDIDNYAPFDYEPLLEPEGAINEFIVTHLPKCFHGISYHWQFSSSAGHPSKDPNKLKAHVWFWLTKPYTSAQLLAWAKATNYKGDKALFNTIQVHYTASPIFEDGVTNPIKTRYGFAEGEFGDEVNLLIEDRILETASTITAPLSRHQRMQDVWANDPVAVMLHEKKMVKSYRPDGGMNIICPRISEHTSESGESSSLYYAAYTGGQKHGRFVCLHEHCKDVPQSLFKEALGYDDIGDVFGSVEDVVAERIVPESKHLTTDQANANRIVNHFKQKIISSADRWYAWNNAYWKPDDSDIMCKGMNLSTIISKEADQWVAKKTSSQDERKKNLDIAENLRAWSKRSEMAGTINAALTMAKKVLAVDTDRLDADPWLLNCPNGTIDLRTGVLRDHNPDDMITKVCGVNYNPNASYEFFESVLEAVTMEAGRVNKPIAKFLKRWFGYCATGSVREQKFVVHYGSGRNGKSTILDMVADVLGDYSGTAAPDLLMSADRSRHPTEIADLFGRRMVTAHETGDGGVLREDFVKQATGGDKLKARRMREDFFEFNPTHKLQLLTNHKPVIKGQDEGIWRRVLLVPYIAKFGTEEEVMDGIANFVRDTRISEKLTAQSEGILRWVVEGAVEWFRDGLNPPDAVLAASKDYQVEQDRVAQFVNEVCEVGEDYQCYLTNGQHYGLYATYTRWCKSSGVYPLQKNRFVDGLSRVIVNFRKGEAKIQTGDGGRRKVVVLHGLRSPEPFDM